MGNGATSGEHAYTIKLTEQNLLGEGADAKVYKVEAKKTGVICAAKFFKIPKHMMDSLENLGYEREL